MDKQKATALELLDEALRTKREAVQMFDEIKNQTAENLQLLARCESLVRNAAEVSPKVRAGTMAEQADELAADSEQLAEVVRNRNCHDVILGIVQLSLMNRELIEIHADYDPANNLVSVVVANIGDFKKHNFKNVPVLLNKTIWLADRFERSDGKSLDNLLELEDKLLELIAEAKDKAEVAA